MMNDDDDGDDDDDDDDGDDDDAAAAAAADDDDDKELLGQTPCGDQDHWLCSRALTCDSRRDPVRSTKKSCAIPSQSRPTPRLKTLCDSSI